jgi:hypothetical protein
VTQQHDIEALKATLAEAKALHREAVKAILEAKRVADRARWRVNDAQAAYFAVRPPRPRPARIKDPEADNPFPPSPTTSGEVA